MSASPFVQKKVDKGARRMHNTIIATRKAIMKDVMQRSQYVEFSKELAKDLLANPMLSQKFCLQKGGVELAPRRRPSDNSIGVVNLYMSREQRTAAGGTFKWHPFFNALRLNGWTESDQKFWGILAGGWVEYTKELEICTWKLRLNDHPDYWQEYARVRWDAADATALDLWSMTATLYLPEFTPFKPR
jgi:hypothetical protein